MGELPVVSGRDVVKALAALGYEVDRQRGSHIVLRQSAAPHRRTAAPSFRITARSRRGRSARSSGRPG